MLLFFESLLSTCPKKRDFEKRPKAVDSPLPTSDVNKFKPGLEDQLVIDALEGETLKILVFSMNKLGESTVQRTTEIF